MGHHGEGVSQPGGAISSIGVGPTRCVWRHNRIVSLCCAGRQDDKLAHTLLQRRSKIKKLQGQVGTCDLSSSGGREGGD